MSFLPVADLQQRHGFGQAPPRFCMYILPQKSTERVGWIGGDPGRDKTQELLAEIHRKHLHIQEIKVEVAPMMLKLDAEGLCLLESELCANHS